MSKNNTNLRHFMKEIMKLCKKYDIELSACDEGNVRISIHSEKHPRKKIIAYEFFFSPKEATIGRDFNQELYLKITKEETDELS